MVIQDRWSTTAVFAELSGVLRCCLSYAAAVRPWLLLAGPVQRKASGEPVVLQAFHRFHREEDKWNHLVSECRMWSRAMSLSDSLKEPVTGQVNTQTFFTELWLLNHDTAESPRGGLISKHWVQTPSGNQSSSSCHLNSLICFKMVNCLHLPCSLKTYLREQLGLDAEMRGWSFGASMQSVDLDALNNPFWSVNPKMW